MLSRTKPWKRNASSEPRARSTRVSTRVRGTQISGGTIRTVGVGDIISMPRGTPHQMDATGGHILYVVIKIMGSAGP